MVRVACDYNCRSLSRVPRLSSGSDVARSLHLGGRRRHRPSTLRVARQKFEELLGLDLLQLGGERIDVLLVQLFEVLHNLHAKRLQTIVAAEHQHIDTLATRGLKFKGCGAQWRLAHLEVGAELVVPRWP